MTTRLRDAPTIIVFSSPLPPSSHSTCGDVKEARSPTTTVLVVATEEVLLSVTSDLSRRASFHEVSRNSSPISFSNFV